MKTVLFHQHGGPEVLEYAEFPTPRPKPGEAFSIIGSTTSHLKDFKTAMDLLVASKLKPILDKTFPLKDAVLAQEYLRDGEHFGKITLDRIVNEETISVV